MTVTKCAICGVGRLRFSVGGKKTEARTFLRCNKCGRYVCAFCIDEVDIFSFNVANLKYLEVGEESDNYFFAPATKKVCIECLGIVESEIDNDDQVININKVLDKINYPVGGLFDKICERDDFMINAMDKSMTYKINKEKLIINVGGIDVPRAGILSFYFAQVNSELISQGWRIYCNSERDSDGESLPDFLEDLELSAKYLAHWLRNKILFLA